MSASQPADRDRDHDSDLPDHDRTRRRLLLGGTAALGAGVAGGLVPAAAQAAPAHAPASGSATAETVSKGGPGRGARVHANNVGYEAAGPKRAVIVARTDSRRPVRYRVVDAGTGRTAYRGTARRAGAVPDWRDDHWPATPQYHWVADFSALTAPGRYVLVLDGGAASDGPAADSAPFRVEAGVLERRTLSHVAHYFKDSRSSGQYDKTDRSLVPSGGTRPVDVHGGWYDAAADWGKHFTQLSDTTYFNTLSIPLTAWAMLATHDALVARKNSDFTALVGWFLEEGLFGADYLVRVHKPGATFYSSISQDEASDLGADPAKRTLDGTQVAYREGAGLAIAALARASTYPVSGDYAPADYLAAAEDAFAYLATHNAGMVNDGKENILDDANGLLAAVELAGATAGSAKADGYREAADGRAAHLMARLAQWRTYHDYWRADDKDRPFFHPSDAGLPAVALLTYLDIADDATARRVRETVRRSMEFELAVTAEVANPYGYARQLVQDAEGRRYSGFFFPHNVTPRSQDAWWQGENARVASLAAAARLAAAKLGDRALARRLHAYATAQLDWVLGANPFSVCMMEGHGNEVPLYQEYPDPVRLGHGSYRWFRSAGGIVNGITGRATDGSGLQWDPGEAETGPNTDWRWLEQWLPHATWYGYAVALGG
ncbi:glycoside hydrolase family 9 protein [Streptomyces sp. NRRL F-5126]|uniref:glycoside hydrolase family 9 protein n=1 Tax=Streptomyces sp. NRRL F-5126 TaxID=1463857 RepID=UPI00068BDA9D|nr:glycoside hydrolase family 9 protein [Streptomyces sp. NRRL F-5126]